MNDPSAQSTTRDVDIAGSRADREIAWRKRSDLICSEQESGTWIVKDPLSLQYSLLSVLEMAVLQKLDGRQSLSGLVASLQNAWPADDLQSDDVMEFLNQLIQNQLVIPTSPHRPLQARDESTANRKRGIMAGLSSLMRIRICLLDPAPLLAWLQPLSLRLFSRRSAWILGLLFSAALTITVLRFGQFVENLPGPWDFFGPDNLLLLLFTFVAVKTLHECGHALAARRFGAECHEAGIMFMLFTPLLYTNVTDAWILDRRSRLIITSAGMLVELALASVATILWFFAAPGIVKSLLANVMMLCTAGTLLFNGNPLLRYDGYFLLTDAVGEPNLMQRSSASVHRLLETLLFGGREDCAKQPPAHRRESWWVLSYGLCSGAYRLSLTVAILVMLSGLFDQWNLKIAGTMLMISAAVSMVIMPVFSTGSGMFVEWFHRVDRRRSALRATIIMAIITACLFVPLPRSVTVPAVVEPAGIPVFATLPGQLNSFAHYGQVMEPGDSIAVLGDPTLERELIQLNSDVRMQEMRVRVMELSRGTGGGEQLPETKQMLESAILRRNQFEQELQRHRVISPCHGVLMPPRAQPERTEEQELPGWSGRPLDSANIGSLIPPGTVLGYLCDARETDILMTLSNEQRHDIREGQSAQFQWRGNPSVVLQGTIRQLASLEVREIPEELTTAGLLAPLSAAGPEQESRRWEAVFHGIAANSAEQPVLYSTGFVRVQVEPASLVSRAMRFLEAAFE